jgi:hypothetical protein
MKRELKSSLSTAQRKNMKVHTLQKFTGLKLDFLCWGTAVSIL